MNERERLLDEIEKIKYELSVTIPQELQDAATSGDLRENTEFSVAAFQQHFLNVRLKQLMDQLQLYSVIDITSIPRDRVGVGSIIKVRHVQSKKIIYFKLVPTITSNFDKKIVEITLQSPIGQMINNKMVKDKITVFSPIGVATYKILKIITIHDTNY